MKTIGIRYLKGHASAIVRRVREKRERYLVSNRGEPVAVLSPIESPPTEKRGNAAWDEWERVCDEAARKWKRDIDPVELVASMRR
jgi:prevent-host-death family protein